LLLAKVEKKMRRYIVLVLVLGTTLIGCNSQASPTALVPGRDAPFPPTWTPTVAAENTATATLVVQPTPTWDGTPPPPSEAYVPRWLPARLYRALDEHEVIMVVDVRSLAAYEQAHIPDAVHIPLGDLPERIGELDGNRTIVFYCLSPNDAVGLQAAMIAYGAGFTKVAVVKGGIQRWYSEGYPIEGTLLTPTPRFVGPPWTVTPLPTSTPLPGTARTSTPIQATRTVTPTATKAQ
jgi:rhodanese-related sulfurtransferase